jgi:DNA-directed RNA polymerase subunit F
MCKAARRTIIVTVLGLAVSLAAWVEAQQPSAPAQPPAAGTPQETEGDLASEMELTRSSIQLRRQAIVTAVMDLTPKEAEAFWPLYREYRLEMAKVGDRISKVLVQYAEQYDTLTDEQANKIINEWLSIEKARTGVKSKYVSRFHKIIPPKKVMRFFQADNKLDAVLLAELASVVPLAR